MALKLGKLISMTAKGQAIEIHGYHVEADGKDGHTARDEWRNCQHPQCAAFRESISGPKQFRVTNGGQR